MCEQALTKFQRLSSDGQVDYLGADGYWIGERDVCRHCMEECAAQNKPFGWGDIRTSFGYYAGKYCDVCWPKSGYRDATDPDAVFEEDYAGESLHGDETDF